MGSKRRLQPMVSPDLIPMIDIVFQLVVFFMVSSTFLVAPSINLDLPRSESEEQISLDLIQITVNSQGERFFMDEQVDDTELVDRLNSLSPSQKDRVVVRGDSQLALQELVSLLDVLRQNGIRNAGILTSQTSSDVPGQSAGTDVRGSGSDSAGEGDEDP